MITTPKFIELTDGNWGSKFFVNTFEIVLFWGHSDGTSTVKMTNDYGRLVKETPQQIMEKIIG